VPDRADDEPGLRRHLSQRDPLEAVRDDNALDGVHNLLAAPGRVHHSGHTPYLAQLCCPSQSAGQLERSIG
jgi:hypothetical protein